MLQTDALESAIRRALDLVGPCSMNELASQLPEYSWAQVFAAINRLLRDDAVAIKHPGPCLCLSRRTALIQTRHVTSVQ